MGCSLAGVGCLVPAQLLRDCTARGWGTSWAALANSYECPIGPAPGDAWLVLSLAALKRIDPALLFAAPLDLTFSNDNVAGPQSPPVVIRGLYVVGAECLAPGAENDDSPFLVRLADRRLILNRTLIDRQFNTRDRRSGLFITATLHAADPWTFQQALTTLAAEAGVVEVLTLPLTPAATPENLEYWSAPALEAISHLLQRAGCELAYDPLADLLSVVEAGGLDPDHDDAVARFNGVRISDAYAVVPAAARPAGVRVLFPRLPHTEGYGSPWFAVEVVGGGGTGTAVVYDDAAALISGPGDPDNLTDLQARAAERAADFFAQLDAADRARLVYPLPLSDPGLLPGSRVRSIRWAHRAGVSRPELGTTTEVRRSERATRTTRDALSVPPPQAGTMTVEEVDGVPSLLNIGVLQFDQADGFVISGSADTFARVDMATADYTHVGIVSVFAQQFGGVKQADQFACGTRTVLNTFLMLGDCDGIDAATSGFTPMTSFVPSTAAHPYVGVSAGQNVDANSTTALQGTARSKGAVFEAAGWVLQSYGDFVLATSGASPPRYGLSWASAGTMPVMGGSAVTGGLTFGGGLYLGGTFSGAVTIGAAVVGGTPSGVLYVNAGGNLAQAVPAAANMLLASGSVGWVSLGTNLSIAAGVLNASGGAGTVTSVDTAAANNGVTATWANTTTTPRLTVGLGLITPTGVAATGAGSFAVTDAATNAVADCLILAHKLSSGTAAAGHGVRVLFEGYDSSGATDTQAWITSEWTSATAGAVKGRLSFRANSSTAINNYAIVIESDGSANRVGFLNTTAAVQQTGDAGAALVTFGLMSGTPTFAGANVTGSVPLAANVTTNANLTGPITSVGNATTVADAELAAIAGLVSAADRIPYFTGSGAASLLTRDTDATLAAASDTNVATQKAVKSYVDNLITGLRYKQPARAATTAGGTLATAFANGQVIDGVTLATGDRILLKNQTAGSENGIYVVNASGAPTRATDADSSAELVNATLLVSEGTLNADTQWTCTNNAPITVGTTALTFVQITGAGMQSADESTLHLSGSVYSINSTYAGQTSIVTLGTVTSGTWSATTIAVNRGGTGLATLTAHAVYVGNGASAPTALAVGTSGQLLIGQTGADPAFTTLSGSGATVTLSAAGVLSISAVANASLANSSVTVNGTAIALGASGTVTAAAGTLTGTTLAAAVVASSLASVGTLTGGATGAGFTVALGTSTVTGLLALAHGGTDADLSATGGASKVLKQLSAGAAVTVGQLAFSDLTGSLAMSQVAITTDVSASRATSAQSLTQNAWNTLIFNSEATDAINEYDPTTGVFTPAATGLYLITVGYTGTGAIGRGITAVWTGTTAELARVADGTLTQVGGTLMVSLTGGTAYTFRAFPTDAGVTAAVATTALKIRRLS